MTVTEGRPGGKIRKLDEDGVLAIDISDRPTAPVTAVVPFYNEEKYIEATLRSLVDQEIRPERILLIDNGSTDESVAICVQFAADRPGIDISILNVDKPGKIHALEAVTSKLRTEYVAFCDADTKYPKHYFRKAMALFSSGDANLVGILAVGVTQPARSVASSAFRRKTAFVGRVLAKQCHSGGFGQVFRTNAYKRIGGYDASLWPYVLEDHEIVHRMLSVGTILYDAAFWCEPSNRRSDRSDVTWTLREQLLYHLTPYRLKDWYFHRFLGPRLQDRKMTNEALRRQPWSS
ncbi:MAG: glycosyltransferase family A protein [Pseudomonadota bacterium]